MHKIWTIAWKEIYTTFTDRNLVLIMVASPLVLSTIVALAFGGLGGGDIPIQDIPVVLVNHDRAGAFGVSFGSILQSLLIPGEERSTSGELPGCDRQGAAEPAEDGITLSDLTEAVVMDEALARSLIAGGEIEFRHDVADEQAYLEGVAKAAVDQGIYTAAIIIPQDFSQRLSYVPVVHPHLEQTGVTVYANSGSPIAAGIISSIAESISNQFVTGSIAIAATFEQLQASYGPSALAGAASADLSAAFACAFAPAGGTVQLQAESVQAAQEGSATRSILVWVGSAQAMFFALFTAQFGVLGLYTERRQWTLQRLVVSPTPRSHILAGNLIGVFMSVLFQVLALVLALTLIGSLLQRRLDLIFGDDLPLLFGLILAVAVAVAGFGMLMAAVVKSPEQGGIIGPVANMAMGVLGGAFGFILPRAASMFSIVYWGREAFQKLAAGQTDIGLNLLVLLAQGAAMYAVGVLLFNRRFEMQ